MFLAQRQDLFREVEDIVLLCRPPLFCKRIVSVTAKSTRKICAQRAMVPSSYHPDLRSVQELRYPSRGKQQRKREFQTFDVAFHPVHDPLDVMVIEKRYEVVWIRKQKILCQAFEHC